MSLANILEKERFKKNKYSQKYPGEEFKISNSLTTEEDELRELFDKKNVYFFNQSIISEKSTKKIANEEQKLEEVFNRLVKQWLSETGNISSTNEACIHPAYQQIIGLGKEAIPLLLRELEKKSGRWFWALKAISREDPVPPEKRGKTREMISAWLDWGKNKGYIW